MVHSFRLSTICIGVSAFFLATPNIARALSAVEVNQIAKAVTVHITSQTPGSGVIIEQQGNVYTVLTAAHVVRTADDYEISTADGQLYAVNNASIKRLPGVDLATVQFTSSKTYPTAQTGNSRQTSEGNLSYVAGFPLQTQAITTSIYTFTEGKITANATRPLADGYSLVYSNNTLPGMSGGPVLNADGQLIGIHGRADTTEQSQTSNPDVYLKTGFNLGIPMHTFLGWASGKTPPLTTSNTTPTADDFFLQGQQKFKQKNYQGAYTDYDRAIEVNPRYANAYIGRGYVRQLDKDLGGAISDFTKAIEIDPQLTIAYHRRGEARQNLKDYQGAIADFSRAIRIDPKSGSYYHRALAKYLLRDDRGAIADFDQAIKLNPSNARTYYNRGSAKDNLKDYKGALADYNIAIRLQPKFPFAYLKRATVKARARDIKGALADLNLSVRSDPNYADAYRDRALVKRFLGDIKGAIADYRRAAQLFKQQGNTQQYQKVLVELKKL